MMLLPPLMLALALLLARDTAAACGPALPHCLRGNDSIYGFGPGDPESHSASACCAAAQAWAPQAQAWELATRVPAKHGPECNIMAEFVPTNRTGLRCTSGQLVAGANAGHNLQAEPRSTTVTASLEQATTPPFSPETDKIIWNLGKTATPATGGCPKLGEPCPLVTVNRTLTDRLAERITVLDFGADRSCHGATEESCKVDSTVAFQNAIDYCGGEDSTPESWQTIYVPPGYYRIDGTITISGQSMVLERGAVLVRRRAITMNGDPLIRIVGTNGRLIGGGTLLSENPSHRGVLNIGPTNLTVYNNIEFNVVAGIHIHGAGTAATEDCYSKVAGPVTCTGIHMDSSEPFVGGSCYENVVKDVTIGGTDAGIYMGKYVNANQLSGIMMGSIGRYGYLLVNNTENSVFGGFQTGGGNASIDHTVIAGRGSGYNWFVSVQAEPGPGSRYFDFDNASEANAVIGHDNTFSGATSQDPRFLYQEGRTFHMGNFNSSAPGGAAGFDYARTMQVQGSAWIQNLTHGGAGTRLGLATEGVEVVDGEPLILNDTSRHILRISDLGLLAQRPSTSFGGAFYEITIAGPAVAWPEGATTNTEGGSPAVSTYLGKYVVTPVGAMPEHGVHAPSLSIAALEQRNLRWRDTGASQNDALEIELSRGDIKRDLVVEVRRAGRACTTPRVELV